MYSHEEDGETLAFMEDNKGDNEFPMIVKMNDSDFEGAQVWFHPKVTSIMNVLDGRQVLPVPEEQESVKTSKIIPLLAFLVPLFMNGGKPFNTVDAYKCFRDEFLEKAPLPLRLRSAYITNFLLAAAGYDDSEDDEDKDSQLVADLKELPMDPVLMQWASTHYSSVQKIAGIYDKWKQRTIDRQGVGQVAVDTQDIANQESVTLQHRSPEDLVHIRINANTNTSGAVVTVTATGDSASIGNETGREGSVATANLLGGSARTTHASEGNQMGFAATANLQEGSARTVSETMAMASLPGGSARTTIDLGRQARGKRQT